MKLTERPVLLSLYDAFKSMSRYDPYSIVSSAVANGKYAMISRLVKGDGRVRQRAALPTVFLNSTNKTIHTLRVEMRERGVEKEFFYLVRTARSLARKYHAGMPVCIKLLGQTAEVSVSNKLPFKEFEHMYQVYRYVS